MVEDGGHTGWTNEKDKNQRFLCSSAGSRLVDGVYERESTIPARDGYQIPVRVYGRHGTERPQGLVVFYHPGGLTEGGLETEDRKIIVYSISRNDSHLTTIQTLVGGWLSIVPQSLSTWTTVSARSTDIQFL